MCDKKNVLIIGGGLGGLFTGAFLSKENCKVTVLEKNTIIGGGLQTFSRFGHRFETGMHILGGFKKGGVLNKMCSYLGVMDSLKIVELDRDCMDSLTYMEDGKTYKIAMGRENFIESFASEFPAERENLKRYVDKMYELTEEVDLFYLRPEKDNFFLHSEMFLWPADKFISHFIKDEKLCSILSYMNPLYGGVKGHTPAYVHALINVFYIEEESRFVGGSQQLADALADVIRKNGGEVLAGNPATHINVEGQQIANVEAADGKRYEADVYISAIHPCSMLDIIDEHAFNKAYRSRLREIPNSNSAFLTFIVFNEKTFRYINHNCYYQQDYDMSWTHGEYNDDTWPTGFLYITPPSKDGIYADTMIINGVMNFDDVEKWRDTKHGARGADYDEWKLKHQEKILDKMEQLHPGFRKCIKHVFSASPLTFLDYYNTKDGSIYGYGKDSENITYSQISIFTKLKNLYLTGQNVNLHGICGVPLTAINTAEAIVGRNVVLNKINECEANRG